jgi:hypothetical protein
MSDRADSSPYERLDELTAIKNNFEAELGRQPGHGQGGGRREQLSRDHSDVEQARADEVLRLKQEAGIPFDEIGRHLDQTDPARESPDYEAGS